MAYNQIATMARSTSLVTRIAAAAADEGVDKDPIRWAHDNIWSIVTEPGWADAWSYALSVDTVNVNPDTGARDDVITDAMILSAVQPRVAATA